MPKPQKPLFPRRQQNSWRNYQADLQRVGIVRRIWRRLPVRAISGVVLTLVAVVGLCGLFQSASGLPQTVADRIAAAIPTAAEPIGKAELRQILNEKAFANLTEKSLELPVDGGVLQVETTLDVGLQNFLLDKIDRRYSRYVGIVVMDAATGRILAMAGFDKSDPERNPCLQSHFPAASIFKIVTAASAVDQYGLNAHSPVHFNGAKHTLYKRQLSEKIDRNTTTVSFADAFADSVNPVFGKLGGLRLRNTLLEKSAEAFGFNAELDFELPISPSHFRVGDQPYNWAEIASGFNRETTISPLHGAVMASAVLNAGHMVTPFIVDTVVDASGTPLYQGQAGREAEQTMSARAAAVLREMMGETVITGTARKAFRNYRKDDVLSRLEIGGKTGSIDNQSHDVRFDWFVGFARERQGGRQVVVAAMVGHEKFIGTRAGEYARMALTYYFSNHGVGHPAVSRPATATATTPRIPRRPRSV